MYRAKVQIEKLKNKKFAIGALSETFFQTIKIGKA